MFDTKRKAGRQSSHGLYLKSVGTPLMGLLFVGLSTQASALDAKSIAANSFVQATPAVVSPLTQDQPRFLPVAFRTPRIKAGKEPEFQGGPAIARRLTAEQYQRIITDVFGSSVDVTGRF